MRFVVDSNIWIKLLRGERRVAARLDQATANGDELLVSPVAFYEVTRGLIKRGDQESLEFINDLWEQLLWVDLRRPTWERAAIIHSEMVQRNQKREDADVLMAATALVEKAVLVTDNVRHFEGMGIQFENWAA